MKLTHDEIVERFATVTLTVALEQRMQDLLNSFIEFAEILNSELPECRAKSLALTSIEETAMWAIKALSRELIGYEFPAVIDTDRQKELKQIPEPGTSEWDRQNPADDQTVKHDI